MVTFFVKYCKNQDQYDTRRYCLGVKFLSELSKCINRQSFPSVMKKKFHPPLYVSIAFSIFFFLQKLMLQPFYAGT